MANRTKAERPIFIFNKIQTLLDGFSHNDIYDISIKHHYGKYIQVAFKTKNMDNFDWLLTHIMESKYYDLVYFSRDNFNSIVLSLEFDNITGDLRYNK